MSSRVARIAASIPYLKAAMTCQTCIHRLDVTLWGLWMATGCRVGLTIRACCADHQPTVRKP